MKIAIATAVYHPMINGVAVFSYHLARGLAARGHQVMVLCPSQSGHPYTRTEHFPAASSAPNRGSLKVVYLSSRQLKIYPDQIHPTEPPHQLFGRDLPQLLYQHGLPVSFFPLVATTRALDRFQPDIIHLQVSDPIGLAAASYAHRHHIPLVTTEHNQPEVLTDSLHLPPLVKKPLNSFLSAYFVHRQNQGDFATMPTQQAIKNLIGPHGRTFKIPVAAVSNGVNLDNFHPGQPDRAFYQKYDLPPDAPLILYVGRVDPEKKVDLLLRAFAAAHRAVPEAHLVIAGDGVALSGLREQAQKLNLSDAAPVHTKAASVQPKTASITPDATKFIHFLGRVTPPDLYQVYQSATLFATMSEIETQGIVLIEAAASGLPLIAVNRGAVSEVCQDGQNGCLCPPGDVKAVATAMVKILRQPELQRKFRQRSLAIAKTHDLEHTLDQFENIYRKLLSDKEMGAQ